MDVSLTEAQRRFVESKVAAGEFASVGAVVAEALARMTERERTDAPTLEAERRRYREWVADTRGKLEEGHRDVQRGESFDGEQVFAEIDSWLKSGTSPQDRPGTRSGDAREPS